jgi:hypothetical protein
VILLSEPEIDNQMNLLPASPSKETSPPPSKETSPPPSKETSPPLSASNKSSSVTLAEVSTEEDTEETTDSQTPQKKVEKNEPQEKLKKKVEILDVIPNKDLDFESQVATLPSFKKKSTEPKIDKKSQQEHESTKIRRPSQMKMKKKNALGKLASAKKSSGDSVGEDLTLAVIGISSPTDFLSMMNSVGKVKISHLSPNTRKGFVQFEDPSIATKAQKLCVLLLLLLFFFMFFQI